jgi:hypothetical protein
MKKKAPFGELSPPTNDEEPVSGLETSLISNSDLLSETTNSEIHKKYLEEQRLTQLELAEFEMIERDLDNIAVTPLLMSTEIKNFPKPLPSNGKTKQAQHENIHDEVINSDWSNKPADYYLGIPDYSISQFGRNSRNRYEEDDDDDEAVHERERYSDKEAYYDNEDEQEHYGGYGTGSDSERIPNLQKPNFNYEEPEEEEQASLEELPSVALVADTHFIRVSQNPFLNSTHHSKKHSIYDDEESQGSQIDDHHQQNLTQGSIDDSVSWGNVTTTPKHPAIRPKLSTETSRKSDTPIRSRNSPAPVRYQTSNLSSGALGDGSSEWNQKRSSSANRKSSNPSTPSSHSHSRLSSSRKSKELSNTNLETSKSKLIHDEDILTKAKKLEEEIASYQYVIHLFAY